MAKTYPLDPNVPANTESPRLGAQRIRELAKAVAELLNVDHYMGTEGGTGTGYNEDAAGEHKQVKFNAPISTPTNEANKMVVYGKDVGGKIELHCLDEDGNEIQLTSGGNLYSPLSKMETIQAVDATGILLKNDGGDTVITVGDDGTATLAVGSQLASSAAPTADADIANKAYVDAWGQVCRMYCAPSQSIPNGWVKVQLDTVRFDPDNISDTVNHRIIPNKAGYYQVNGSILYKGAPGGYVLGVGIFKNGSSASFTYDCIPSSHDTGLCVSDIIECNGSTDYLELYAFNTYGSSISLNGSSTTDFLSVSRVEI